MSKRQPKLLDKPIISVNNQYKTDIPCNNNPNIPCTDKDGNMKSTEYYQWGPGPDTKYDEKYKKYLSEAISEKDDRIPNRRMIKYMQYNPDNSFMLKRLTPQGSPPDKPIKLLTEYFNKYTLQNMSDFAKNEDFGCKKGCPLQTSRKHNFIVSLPPEERIYIYPNLDRYFGTEFNNPIGDHFKYPRKDANGDIIPELPFTVEWSPRSDIFVFCGLNLLMLDWDNKDFKTNTEGTMKIVREMLAKVANDLSTRVFNGEEVIFAINPSDRGVHAFLLSHPMDPRNQNVLDFMEQTCCDEFYVAFTPLRGWCVRVSPKPDKYDDFVAKPHFSLPEIECNDKNKCGIGNAYQFITSGNPPNVYPKIVKTAYTRYYEIYACYLMLNMLIVFFVTMTQKDRRTVTTEILERGRQLGEERLYTARIREKKEIKAKGTFYDLLKQRMNCFDHRAVIGLRNLSMKIWEYCVKVTKEEAEYNPPVGFSYSMTIKKVGKCTVMARVMMDEYIREYLM